MGKSLKRNDKIIKDIPMNFEQLQHFCFGKFKYTKSQPYQSETTNFDQEKIMKKHQLCLLAFLVCLSGFWSTQIFAGSIASLAQIVYIKANDH